MSKSAARVVAKCGGDSSVARWLGVNQSTVCRWRMRRGDGRKGCNGLIPSQYHQALIDRAISAGIDLYPEDFFDKPGDYDE